MSGVKMIEVNVFEIDRDEPDQIKTNFGMKTFGFLTVPGKGEQVELETAEIGRTGLYHVETVRHRGRTSNAPRAAQAEITLYVSLIRHLREYV